MTKDILNIEDMLIEFIDSGELDGNHVTVCYWDAQDKDTIEVHITKSTQDLNDPKVSLIDRIKTLDKVINRLRRKYKTIYIDEYSTICISLLSEDEQIEKRQYINYSILDKMNDFLENRTDFIKYKNINPSLDIYLGTSPKNIILKASPVNVKVSIDVKKLKEIIQDDNLYNSKFIRWYIETYILRKYKIRITNIDHTYNQRVSQAHIVQYH